MVGAIIEAFHDEKGIKWPLAVAPFSITLMNLMPQDKECIDVSDKIYERLTGEEGYFDTYPSDNSTNFFGAWNVYPFFSSGVILISDINYGLFIVKSSNEL